MAFANLFTRLSAVDEGVQSPVQPAFTHRNETGTRGSARKRKTQDELPGSYRKKRCYQDQTTTAHNTYIDDNTKATRLHMKSRDNEHVPFGFTKEAINSHSYKSGHNSRHCNGPNYKTKNNCNTNKQQQQEKKVKGQKYQHQHENRRRHANGDGKPMSRKGGRGGKHKGVKQDFKVKSTRFMTQEFKDQNALLVNGRLLCRHYLWGRCIKADECQLEHVQGYNNLIKAVCKFYVQGFCTKGETCPYMHKSFPCKFFHRNGKCSQGADCRFSHEPLNDITKQLLDEALKRENDLCELAKKAEQESSQQPANTDESETIEANSTPDVLLQPLRPNFYSSMDTNAEKETLLSQTEAVADIAYEAIPPHASDTAQPHSPPSTSCNHEEPVCYSVEAVLGAQLSRPFPSFFTTPGSQEAMSLSAPQTTSDATLGSANHSEVPYSVEAVLRSCKSVENSTFGQKPTPPTVKTVSYTPQRTFEEIGDRLLSSQRQTKKVMLNSRELGPQLSRPFPSFFTAPVGQESTSLSAPQTSSDATLGSANHSKVPYSVEAVLRSCKSVENSSLSLTTNPLLSSQHQNEKVSLKARDKVNKCQKEVEKKSLPSLGVPADLISNTCHHVSLTTKDHKKHSGHKSESLKTAQRASQLELAEKSLSSKSKGDVKEHMHLPVNITNSVNHQSLICHPEHPPQLKPQLSGQTSDSQSSVKSSSTSSSFTKGRAAVPVALVASFVKTSKTGNSGGHHLAAKQLSEIRQLSKKTQSDLRRGTQQLYSTKITPECSSKTANGGDPSVRCNDTQKINFFSLFASPIADSVTPAPESLTAPQGFIQAPQSADFTSKDRYVEPDKTPAASFLSLFATPLSETTAESPCLSPAHKPVSPKLSPGPKYENEPLNQQVNPVCSRMSDLLSETPTKPNPPTTQAQQQPPNTASPRAATDNSVLKTLFLCLSPYQDDRKQRDSIQISVHSKNETKDKSSPECVFVKRKCKKKGKRKKKLMTQGSYQQSTEESAAGSSEPYFQTTQIPSESTGGSALSSPGVTEPQVRNSALHNFPFKPLMQHHTRPRLKHTSVEGKELNGSVAVTPLKDLFKTLDTSVFNSGH